MYCSTCGKSLNENLNYCNGCGARNEKSGLVVGNSNVRLFASAAGAMGVFGLIGFFPVLKVLLDSRLDQAAILLILTAYLVTVFLLFAVMIGHVWTHSGDIRSKGKNKDERKEYAPPSSFRAVNTAQLDEPHQPAMSVTENTTRTLDTVPVAKR